MPPRTVKRGGAAAGPKRKAAAKPELEATATAAEDQLRDVVEELPKDFVEEAAEEERLPAVEEKTSIEGEKLDLNRSDDPTTEEEVNKEPLEEFGKEEQLDLDDNDPEYENEEYSGVDFDDKEVEQEDVQEVEEVPEDLEEEHVVEEDADLVEEELVEELEAEEDDEVAAEDVDHSHELDAAEEVEHHEMVKERRKRKEFEVFVGGLDKDVTEADLRKVFSQVGDVTEIRLMRNPQTKKNKGFAFLRFATVEQAKRAVMELKNPVINGKQCGVSPSQDSDTLFLGNICKTWTKEALKEKLKHYGVNNVEDLTLVEDSNNQGMSRGFAFLEFSSRSDAMDAYKRLQKRDVLFGVDRPAKVSFADSFIDPGDEIMAQVKTIFIDGLSPSWDEDYVRELLKKYGEIEKIELARNMPSARRKDYGFVTFNTHDAAVTCAKNINNAELGEGSRKSKVRARLSRPLQRGKGRHSSSGKFRSSHGASRPATRSPWLRPAPRALPPLPIRGKHAPSTSGKRDVGSRSRRPPVPVRPRPPAPPSMPYDRRAPASSKREYSRREEFPPPRSNRAAAGYNSRTVLERQPSSSRDYYSSLPSGYADIPRGTSRTSARRTYVDDTYDPRLERPPPPPSYRDGHARDYGPVSGSKRPYAALADVPPRYADTGARHSRPRVDYELGPRASHYVDAYDDRLGRPNLGYGDGRNSISSQDTHGLYSSRHGMGYGGSYGADDANGMYPSGYGSDYMPRGGDVGGRPYSSMYSSRGMGGSGGYMGTGRSGSYY